MRRICPRRLSPKRLFPVVRDQARASKKPSPIQTFGPAKIELLTVSSDAEPGVPWHAYDCPGVDEVDWSELLREPE